MAPFSFPKVSLDKGGTQPLTADMDVVPFGEALSK